MDGHSCLPVFAGAVHVEGFGFRGLGFRNAGSPAALRKGIFEEICMYRVI